MRDIRDLLSGPLHIERIVFGYDITHVRYEPVFSEEKRTHYYIGASSNDRFMLIEIPSPEAANGPVDLLKLAAPMVVARTSDTDFYDIGLLIAPLPRSAPDSNLEKMFRARLHPLQECLQLGLMVAKPGSLRCDGDRFHADYSDEMKNQRGDFSIGFGRPGEEVPESVKEKFLADLQTAPENRVPRPPSRTVLRQEVHGRLNRDGKVIWSSDGNLEPRTIAPPAPGSVEARILAHWAAEREARLAKGIDGEWVRDAQGNVTRIRFDVNRGVPCRIEFEYAPSADLPLPFPHRISRFIDSSEFETVVPSWQMTIYAARISGQPQDDAAFVPWPHLKEGSYVRGKAMPNGRFAVADPKDQNLCDDLLRARRFPPI